MASLVYLITSRHKCMSSLHSKSSALSVPSSSFSSFFPDALCVNLSPLWHLFPLCTFTHCAFTSFQIFSLLLQLETAKWLVVSLVIVWTCNQCVCVFFLEEWKKETSIYFSSIIFRKSHTECLFKDFEVKSHLNWYQNITFKTYIKRS